MSPFEHQLAQAIAAGNYAFIAQPDGKPEIDLLRLAPRVAAAIHAAVKAAGEWSLDAIRRGELPGDTAAEQMTRVYRGAALAALLGEG